jgi:hypothetical protein
MPPERRWDKSAGPFFRLLADMYGVERVLTMDERLKSLVLEWVREVECMVLALGVVVNRFTEEEAVESSYQVSVSYISELLQLLKARSNGEVAVGSRPLAPMVRFAGFSQDTARAMAPLVETILVHPAPFVPTARQLREEETVTLYTLFSGGWVLYFCHPIWRLCPDLIPPGWDTPALRATLTEPNRST